MFGLVTGGSDAAHNKGRESEPFRCHFCGSTQSLEVGEYQGGDVEQLQSKGSTSRKKMVCQTVKYGIRCASMQQHIQITEAPQPVLDS